MKTPLREIIRTQIAQNGPMDLGTYMSFCLLHPEHGYYTTCDPFGAGGDFITAPDVSQLFGEMIGFWVADIWAQMGRPRDFLLVELGPGRGTLMADALRILGAVAECRPHIYMVEASPKLQAVQRTTLSALAGMTVHWVDDVDQVPTHAPLIIVNNEFFDALPVRQVVRSAHGTDEVVVGLGGDALTLGRMPSALHLLDPVPFDRVIEISPARDAYAQKIFDRLRAQTGAALTIDYGYVTPPGASTLQALRDHRPVPILTEPGECDLTALVHFGRLVELAQECDVRMAGPVGQGAFLENLGIAARAAKIAATATDTQKQALLSGLHRLTAADEMGDLFKVLAVWHHPHTLTPAGF